MSRVDNQSYEQTWSDFMAIGKAEGFFPSTPKEYVGAWQHLVDTGLAWELRASFGKKADEMIQAGIIKKREMAAESGLK